MKVERQQKWSSNHLSLNVKGHNQCEANHSRGDVNQKSMAAADDKQNSRPTANYQDRDCNQGPGRAATRNNVPGSNNIQLQLAGHRIICY